MQSMVGSGIALGGVFIYSLVTDYFETLAKKAAK
jgi:hypothetical protein